MIEMTTPRKSVTLVAAKHVPQILQLREDGKSWRNIATALGVSRGAIKRALLAAGHSVDALAPVAHAWTSEEDERLIVGRSALYEDGAMVRPGLTGRELFAVLPHIPARLVKRRRDYLLAAGKMRRSQG